MPLHAIKEFAGHSNISETLRYVKYLPQQIELGAKVSSTLGVLPGAKINQTQSREDEIECPNCSFAFKLKKPSILELVKAS